MYYFHPDHLGSSSYITDASGEVYQHLEYFAFGETFVEEHSNTDKMPYLYNGKELDEETGLYYYGARYYDAKTSVWLSVDPLASQAPGWTPYRAFFNNPINYVDPDGRFEDDPIYNKRGIKIGDDGKADGKVYIARGRVARDVKQATKAGEFYSGSLVESSNVMKIPTGGVMDDVISSVDDTRTSGREHGGHADFGDANATRWDEGPEAKLTTGADGAKALSASITPFRVDGKRANVDASKVEFWWHTHPRVAVGGIQLGSSNPSPSDRNFQGDMQSFGFKGNPFVIGVRDQKVSFYNKDRVVLRMNYEVFKKIGKQ